ncbi:TPA: hypothetical protein EYG96_00490 [Candidatus Gracilibacteria bacterium]|nr:hypothetical protein [Candidatus Peregrinibacteria bacterium]HIQ56507.1 hypothetical protein [Candidatus Gracilibacteria bacterium]
MKNTIKKISTLSLLTIATFLSGCEAVDSALEIKQNVENQVTDITNNINKIQANLEQKKAELDKKLQELEDAQNALSQLFGNDSLEAKEKEISIKKEIQTLEKKTIQIKNDVLEDTQNIEILEDSKKTEQESASSGVFSIE